jgi:hypothetical protein
MSNHSHQDDHEPNRDLVESSGIKAKPILVFLGALAAATILVLIIIKGLQYGFRKMDEMEARQPATEVSGQKLPPEPRLQGAPEPVPDKAGEIRPSQLPLDDLKTYRERVNRLAAEYDWVDKQGGIARIPIERAKELIAEKGLPSLSDTAIKQVQSAEVVRQEVYNSDSSGGRIIKSSQTAGVPQANPANATPVATPSTGPQQPARPAGQNPSEQRAPRPNAATKAAAGKQ